jgi:hypothetical protein
VPLEFSFCTTDLITLDSPVAAPAGIVYSTNPHKAEASNGKTYFVKGPELEVVFGEIAGCLLASTVGITVPPVAICTAGQDKLAGSEKVDQAFRDASIPLKRPQNVANFQDLYNVIVVDSWLGNTDRNSGNLLAVPSGKRVELVMIDFEKSVALRPHPLIQSTMIEYRRLWPTEDLGRYAREHKPLLPPQAILESIGRINEGRCREILRPLIQALDTVQWAEDSIGAVANRAANIGRIVGEVWRSI